MVTHLLFLRVVNDFIRLRYVLGLKWTCQCTNLVSFEPEYKIYTNLFKPLQEYLKNIILIITVFRGIKLSTEYIFIYDRL